MSHNKVKDNRTDCIFRYKDSKGQLVCSNYGYDASEWVNGYGYHLIDLSNKVVKDPEDAIISAIDYLVEHNLIK